MMSNFLAAFSVASRIESETLQDLMKKVEPYATGFTELMSAFAGATFDNGLYRLHVLQDIVKWTQTVEEAFPKFKDRTVCFGYDWLGRHFALDKRRAASRQMLILLLEPGAGEAMEIPATFAAFHNEELVQYRTDALAFDFYQKWLSSGGASPSHDQCVGYKVPLFLGGKDTVDNLELSDMDVYWSICGQTRNATRS